MKKYDNYKDSGIEWIGVIPEHWDVKKLKFLVKEPLKYGANESAEEEILEDPRYIRITDFGNDGKLKNDTFKSLSFEKAENFLLKEGDVLFARSGATVGKTFLFKDYSGIACFAGYLIKASCDLNKMKPEFLYEFTNSGGYENWKQSIFQQSTIQNIGADKYNQLKIGIPPISEQTTIANYLDHKTTQIDTLIVKKEQFISLLQEERTAVISQAVTKGLDPKVKMKDSGIEWLGEIPEHWKTHRIDWVTNIVRGNTGFKKDELLGNGEYVALQYGKTYKVDIVDDNFNFFVNSEFFKESQVVSKGDTILISTSETVEDLGHTCFYNNGNIGLLGGEQILLKPNRKVLYEKYLYQYARQFGLELKKYAKGLKVFRFSTTDLKQIFIAIPSIEEQIQIADFLDRETIRIDSLISKSKQEIELLKEYKTALISEVVTGKVDVRNVILN